MEPDPRADRLAIPVIVLDAPWRVLALCEAMARTAPELRAGYLGSLSVHDLADPTVAG